MTLGCGSQQRTPDPTTHPVTGVVSLPDGKPLTAGQINFQKPDESTYTVTGEIGPDGRFKLQTLVDERLIDGAPEGTYRVTVFPPVPEDQNVRVYELVKPYTVVAGENHFPIQLPP